MGSAFNIRLSPKIRQEFEALTAKKPQLREGLDETLQDARQNIRSYRKLRTTHHHYYELSTGSAYVHYRYYEVSIHRVHVRGAGDYRLILAFIQNPEERQAEIVPLYLSKEHITVPEQMKRIEWIAEDYPNPVNWEPLTA